MAQGSIKQDPKTKLYRFVVDVAKKGEKRKQVKRGGFKKRSEAQAAMTKLLNEVNEGEYISPDKTVFVDYMLNVWIAEKERNNHMTRLTADSYRSYIKNHIKPILPTITLGELQAKDIKHVVKSMQTREIKKQKKTITLSDSTIQRIYNMIISALNYAKQDGLIKTNPAKKVDRPKVPKRKLNIWNITQVKTFLEGFKNSRHYIVFFLALHTGMRQGEILGLPWSNVDMKKKRIMITQTLEHDGKGIKEGAKSSAGIRSISISDEIVEELMKQRKRIEHEKELAGELYIDNDLVCCTNIGKPVFPDTLTHLMRAKIKTLGLPKIRFHDLRHTAASLLLALGYHPKVVSEILGHASVTITLDTYSHLLKNMQAEATQGLSQLLTAEIKVEQK
ncbi:tyrosine-type recombinase/integrase [Paenibacillus sp. FSL H3-0333]|uniref:tyrosine-type recombinase/integrase n=1 Tax=Paenibacillus sp. FSL H3-0333 TaxID=2921373 RepID=UPI0030FC7C5E